ncbi:MAG: phosphatidylserine decarboxylase [Elusimicrobiota bacterium]
MVNIAKEGVSFVMAGFLIAAVGVAFANVTGIRAFHALTIVGVLAAVFCAYFFRNPERPHPTDRTKIYSPGDGRVLSVVQEPLHDGLTVRIFLSIFDVHFQRSPYWGPVREVTYVEGRFALAMRLQANENERNIVRIAAEGRPGEIVVEQIAGAIARRIRCWVDEGDPLEAGQRYGLIQFGSQVAVHLPVGAQPLVKPGDRVVGGITPIALWTKGN